MLRVLIADDEPPARKRLCKLLEPLRESERIAILGEARDGEEALDVLRQQDIDLLFLDIQMPKYDGFELIERLEPEKRPVTVFVTAYDEYALKAFEANAADYLLKPIERERLHQAVERAEHLVNASVPHASEQKLDQLLAWVRARRANEEQAYVQQISVPVRDRTLLVPVADLVSAEIDEGVTRLFTLEEDRMDTQRKLRHHVVNYTLDQLEESLDPAEFVRVHRSAIVQIGHIKEMVSWFSGRLKLIMVGDHEVIASRDRSRRLKERLSL